jgi:hypothetical protein
LASTMYHPFTAPAVENKGLSDLVGATFLGSAARLAPKSVGFTLRVWSALI